MGSACSSCRSANTVNEISKEDKPTVKHDSKTSHGSQKWGIEVNNLTEMKDPHPSPATEGEILQSSDTPKEEEYQSNHTSEEEQEDKLLSTQTSLTLLSVSSSANNETVAKETESKLHNDAHYKYFKAIVTAKVLSVRQRKRLLLRVMHGDVTLSVPHSSRIIRIFLSSTFSDMRHERDALITDVFPKLKDACHGKGYQFQVVDMRWGVREYATNFHKTADICLQEIERCNRISEGPRFVAFLSERYGYRMFPNRIEEGIFERMLEKVKDKDTIELLNKWFKKDSNLAPPTYILQPVEQSVPLDESVSLDRSPLVENAPERWYTENEKMREAVRNVSMCGVFPCILYAEDFELLQKYQQCDQNLFTRWYREDDTTHPKTFVLRSDTDEQQYLSEYDSMRTAIYNASKIISKKHGCRFFPKTLHTENFQRLKNSVKKEERRLLDRWFQKGDNCYTLSNAGMSRPFFCKEVEDTQMALTNAVKIVLHIVGSPVSICEREKYELERLQEGQISHIKQHIITATEKKLLEKLLDNSEGIVPFTYVFSKSAKESYRSREETEKLQKLLEKAAKVLLRVYDNKDSRSKPNNGDNDNLTAGERDLLKKYFNMNGHMHTEGQGQDAKNNQEEDMLKALERTVELVSTMRGLPISTNTGEQPHLSHLKNILTSTGDETLLKRWFTINKYKRAKIQWGEAEKKLREILYQALESLNPEMAQKMFLHSVTESEIRHSGIFTNETARMQSRFYFRNIVNMEKDTKDTNDILDKYRDRKDKSLKEEHQGDKLLHNLKEKLKQLLPQDLITVWPNTRNSMKDDEDTTLRTERRGELQKGHGCIGNTINVYSVSWVSEMGFDPDEDPQHKNYVFQLCKDFKANFLEDIHSLEAGMDLKETHILEIKRHMRLCQEKIRQFSGRSLILQNVSEFIGSHSDHQMLVIYGQDESGKTSIMAKTVEMAWEKYAMKGVVLFRFIGATVASKTFDSLLFSLIYQLKWMRHESDFIDDIPLKTDECIKRFHELLQLLNEFKVTLVLDSLDKLENISESQKQELLSSLPYNVKVIVSATTSEVLGDKKVDKVEVKDLSDNDRNAILEKLLKESKRELTKEQEDMVKKASKDCDKPFFLKLCFETTSDWHSYSTHLSLKPDVKSLINDFFDKLEIQHGKVFTSWTLGLISISQSGLTEEDIQETLSSEQEVLDDVFQFWNYPVRRLPPHLLISFKAQVGQYLVNREDNGVSTLYWCHPTFLKVARERYGNIETRLHEGLIKSFSSELTNDTLKVMIGQTQQFNPLMVRKVNNLPFHMLQSGNLEMLKEKYLQNFNFVHARIQLAGIRTVHGDFLKAKEAFPKDEYLSTMGDTLQLSKEALYYDPNILASQIMGRRPKLNDDFIANCRKSGVYLEAGKQLLRTPKMLHMKKPLISVRKKEFYLYGLTMASDGQFAIAYSHDGEIHKLDPKDGKLIWKRKTKKQNLENVFLCCEDSILLAMPPHGMQAFGQVNMKYPEPKLIWEKEHLPFKYTPICICGPKTSLAAVFYETAITFYEAETGLKVHSRKAPYNINFCGIAPCTGNVKYALTTSCTRETLVVYDVEERRFLSSRKLHLLVNDQQSLSDDPVKITALTISGDGNQVICGTSANNDLYFLNIRSLETIKLFQGNSSATGKFYITQDGVNVFHPVIHAVNIWHLRCPGRTSTLKDVVNTVNEIAYMDPGKFITCDDNGAFQVWDTEGGKDNEKSPSVKFQKVGIARNYHFMIKRTTASNDDEDEDTESGGGPDHFQLNVEDPQIKARDMALLSKECHVLVIALPKYKGDDYCLHVYDIKRDEHVKKARLGKILPTYVQPLRNMRVIVCAGGRVKLINVDRILDVSTYDGHLPCPVHGPVPKHECILSIEQKTENLPATQKGRNSVNSDDIKADKQETPRSIPRTVNKLLIDSENTIAVAEVHRTPDTELLVFDLKTKKQTYVITTRDTRQEMSEAPNGFSVNLTPSVVTGDYILFLCTEKQNPEQTANEGSVLFVFNFKSGKTKMLRILKNYTLDDLHGDAFQTVTMYENAHVLLSNTDGVQRVFNINDDSTDTFKPKASLAEVIRNIQAADKVPGVIIKKTKLQEMLSSTFATVSSVMMVDEKRFLSSHVDGYLRIFNIKKEKIIQQLDGHKGGCQLYSHPDNPYIISHGCKKRKYFQVWRKNDFSGEGKTHVEHYVSYYADVEMEKFLLLGGQSKYFWALASTSSDPVKFSFHDPERSWTNEH